MNYIKGKGILVGTYSDEDVRNSKDQREVYAMMEKTGYNSVNTEVIKKNGIDYLKVYVCKSEDVRYN